MEIKDLYNRDDVDDLISRINALSHDTPSLWGKMNVAQMLAHNCVGFDMYFNKENYDPPNAFLKFMLSRFLKPSLVGPKPYKRNSRTAPQFIISDERAFDEEKARLIDFLNRIQELGADHFEGKESITLGRMTAREWSTLWSKHLDHHLMQFGV